MACVCLCVCVLDATRIAAERERCIRSSRSMHVCVCVWDPVPPRRGPSDLLSGRLRSPGLRLKPAMSPSHSPSFKHGHTSTVGALPSYPVSLLLSVSLYTSLVDGLFSTATSPLLAFCLPCNTPTHVVWSSPGGDHKACCSQQQPDRSR